MRINEFIKARRLQRGMSLEDVGKIVGVGRSTILKWEQGDIKNMRRDKIAKLSEALDIEPTVLLHDEIIDIGLKDTVTKLIDSLNDEERLKVIEYVQFLKTQEKRK